MNKSEEYDIGEFCAYQHREDKDNGKFTIILQGDIKFSDLIGIKVGNLKITEKEFEEFVEK